MAHLPPGSSVSAPREIRLSAGGHADIQWGLDETALFRLRRKHTSADDRFMRPRRQSVAFIAGFLTAALVAAVWMVWKDGSWNRGRDLPGLPGLESEPVLVVVVGDLQGVAQVRAAIDDERIVAESDDAFALKERRVISESFAGVGPMLTAAGWGDDSLEIVAIRLQAPETDSKRTSELAELMKKPTLNLMEARRALALF
jgi:hypothetical protein